MKASKFIQELSDGDTIVLQHDIEHVINRCCECGTYYDIKIQRSENGIMRMSWTWLGEEPEIEDPVDVVIEGKYCLTYSQNCDMVAGNLMEEPLEAVK